MTLQLFAHPFSSYSQKVLIALYENDTPFTFRMLGSDHPDNGAALVGAWPLGKFPLLRDGTRDVIETTIIIEYLDTRYPGPARLIPEDPDDALEARFLDRVFDLHVMNRMQAYVDNALRPADVAKDPYSVQRAGKALHTIYDWLDQRLAGREWATGKDFSIADCAAAPSLFYADWVEPIGETRTNLAVYRARLLAHPSVARAVEEARPYRHLFPLGAPDRD